MLRLWGGVRVNNVLPIQVPPVQFGDPFGVRLWFGSTASTFALKRAGVRQLIAAGAVGFDKADVEQRTIGEFVERVSGLAFFWGTPYDEVVDMVDDWLDPVEYCAMRCEQPLDRRSFHWLVGVRCDTTSTIGVPVRTSLELREKFAFPRDATGHAAHTDHAAAIRAAANEVVERDALVLSWMIPGWPVAPMEERYFPPEYVAAAAELRCELEGYWLRSLSEPVALVALFGPGGWGATFGSALRSTREASVTAAVQETFMARHAALRADRRSVIATRTSYPIGSLGHLLWGYLNGPVALDWYRRQSASTGTSSVSADTVVRMADPERELNEAMIVADVTLPAFRDQGWNVRRCLLPSAMRRETGFAPHVLRRRRLREQLQIWDLHGAGVRRVPHPFA